MLGQCTFVAMLWYGQADLVSLQKLIVLPLLYWSVLHHFEKWVKCWEYHSVSLKVACSHDINVLSDGAVYSLAHNSPWNAKQNAADR